RISDWPIRTSRSRFPAVLMLSLMLPHADRRRAWAGCPVLLLCLLAAGCAASTAATRRGSDAEHQQDYDRAVVEYTKALRLKPDDTAARLGLERAQRGA